MTQTQYPWWSVLAGLVLGSSVAAPVLADDPSEEDVRRALRLTGRISFFLFLVPLLARPLEVLSGASWASWLVRRRGNFGLAIAGNQMAHVALIRAVYRVSPGPPVAPSVRTGGIIGLTYLALMAILSFEAPQRVAGPRATAIVHRLGLHYLLFVFMYDMVLKEPLGTYRVLTPIWFVAVGIRALAWVSRTRRPVRERA